MDHLRWAYQGLLDAILTYKYCEKCAKHHRHLKEFQVWEFRVESNCLLVVKRAQNFQEQKDMGREPLLAFYCSCFVFETYCIFFNFLNVKIVHFFERESHSTPHGICVLQCCTPCGWNFFLTNDVTEATRK